MSSSPFVAKAWRYPIDEKTWSGYKSLELRDVTITPPGRGEVLVKLRAVSLNYRLEFLVSQGNYPGPLDLGPDGRGLIPTSDGAGEIVALGADVTNWKVGDRVRSLFFEKWLTGPVQDEYVGSALGARVSGCLTQYRVFKANAMLPIPNYQSYEEAATIPCAAVTAWNAFFEKKPVTKDSTVLVLGSGGVSVIGAQLAKAAGARVIATTSNQKKAEKYKSLGVDEVINYRENPEWSGVVRQLTGGKGVDQVLEVGGQGTLIQSLKSVKREGHVHVIGVVGRNKPAESINDLAKMVLYGQITMSGISVGSKEMAEKLDTFMAEHHIKPVIDRVFGWNEVIEALNYQFEGSHFGKVIIEIE